MDDSTGEAPRIPDHSEQVELLARMREVLASLRSLADDRLAVHQISYKQGVPLRHLHGRPAPSVTELASDVGIDPASMTRMLERLEAKGFVERHRSSVDRRVVEVRLLEPGASVATQVADVLGGVLRDHLTGFSGNERKRLRELLERMRTNGRATGHH